MRILIIRHGDPDYSIDSLTEKGWREAELLSKRLVKTNIDAVFCSPLGRAKATMKPYLEKSGKTAEICDWLEEFNYCKIIDPLTGKDKDIWDFMPSFLQENSNFFVKDKWTQIDCIKNSNIEKKIKFVFKGLDDCIAKFGYERDRLFYKVKKGNHKTIAFFCHFGIEAILLSHLFNVSPQAVSQNFNACPSSVTELISEEREEGVAFFRCQRFGDLSHLYAADENPSFSGRFCECFTDDTRH